MSNPLSEISDRIQTAFQADRRIMTFSDYVELFLERPYRMARSAIQYLRDMMDHFGQEEVRSVGRRLPRFRVFDCAFRDGRGRVQGHEAVQGEIYRHVRAAASRGLADRMLLLHGPNGSAKTSLVEALMYGLEAYSHTDEGALYRFNWVFPRTPEGAGLGFGRSGRAESAEYATLPADQIAARISSEMKTHPLLLVPIEHRAELLERALARREEDRGRNFRYLVEGELDPKSKAIYEALLTAHQGDWSAVLRHAQIERFYISKRFRQGAVTIEPQGNVDAEVRLVSADMSVSNLPAYLHNLQLFELGGDLIDANAGILDYSDFLKRPVEMSKYLLTTTERGTISLPHNLAHLNVVMMGTTNEAQLDAFKQIPDFSSFKGRIELVEVPYLLEISKEVRIYSEGAAFSADVHIAPHALLTAARFAVLTRLLRPDPNHFEEPTRSVVRKLTPYDKARLYDGAGAPETFGENDRRTLLSSIDDLRDEFREDGLYEGRFGASAREIRTVLAAAAQGSGTRCLTPMAVLEELRELMRDRSLYEFLQFEPQHGYHDCEKFLETLRGLLVETVVEELQSSMELIQEEEYDRRFVRYFDHVLAYNKGELVRNPRTGEAEPPDAKVMENVERLLVIQEPVSVFRQNLVGKIGAHALDHPGDSVNYRRLFPDILRALKEEFRAERREQILAIQGNLLKVDTDEFRALDEPSRVLALRTRDNMCERFGYCSRCLKDVVSFVTRHL